MIKFRKVSGKHVNPISHTAEMLKKKRISALHIGTDSQRHQKSIVYVTAIAYRYKNKGVHYIYNKLNHKPIKDDWPRLWLETEYTMEVAKLLRKNFPIRLFLFYKTLFINSRMLLSYFLSVKSNNFIFVLPTFSYS